jgi:hypothetical protein
MAPSRLDRRIDMDPSPVRADLMLQELQGSACFRRESEPACFPAPAATGVTTMRIEERLSHDALARALGRGVLDSDHSWRLPSAAADAKARTMTASSNRPDAGIGSANLAPYDAVLACVRCAEREGAAELALPVHSETELRAWTDELRGFAHRVRFAFRAPAAIAARLSLWCDGWPIETVKRATQPAPIVLVAYRRQISFSVRPGGISLAH